MRLGLLPCFRSSLANNTTWQQNKVFSDTRAAGGPAIWLQLENLTFRANVPAMAGTLLLPMQGSVSTKARSASMWPLIQSSDISPPTHGCLPAYRSTMLCNAQDNTVTPQLPIMPKAADISSPLTMHLKRPERRHSPCFRASRGDAPSRIQAPDRLRVCGLVRQVIDTLTIPRLIQGELVAQGVEMMNRPGSTCLQVTSPCWGLRLARAPVTPGSTRRNYHSTHAHHEHLDTLQSTGTEAAGCQVLQPGQPLQTLEILYTHSLPCQHLTKTPLCGSMPSLQSLRWWLWCAAARPIVSCILFSRRPHTRLREYDTSD